jgi:hypothetical protein
MPISGGGAVGGDAYSIAIAHREGDRFVVDVIRGKRGPFDPQSLTISTPALVIWACRQNLVKMATK